MMKTLKMVIFSCIKEKYLDPYRKANFCLRLQNSKTRTITLICVFGIFVLEK